MAEKKKSLRTSSGGIMGKSLSSDSAQLVVDDAVLSSSRETPSCYNIQVSEQKVAREVVTVLQNAAGTVAVECSAGTRQAVATGGAEQTGDCGPAGDGSDDDDSPAGSFGGMSGCGAVEAAGSKKEGSHLPRQVPRTQSRSLLLLTPAAKDVLDGSCEPPTTRVTAEIRTVSSVSRSSIHTVASAHDLTGGRGGMLSLAGASLADDTGISGAVTLLKRRACSFCEEYLKASSDGVVTKSATLVKKRTFSSCEEYLMDTDRLVTEGLTNEKGTHRTPTFAEELTACAGHTEITRAGTAYESCTNSSTSDCCGCVGPTTETSGGNAAGVPPYLRIETLPAMLEEGSAGRICVLLGKKKEALLYSVATPFGLNRWLLVCIYMLYAFLTGCVYFGWPSMSYMLLTSGAYSWRCPKTSEGEFINDLRKSVKNGASSVDNTHGVAGENGSKYYICDEQDTAVGPLFTIAYVTQSLMSVVAGTLLDHVSPKHAAVLGQLLNAMGWVLLACSSYSFQAYIPAMVFIGLGADTAYLPTLLIAALFPGKRATVITLLGSANTASFAVPMLLEMLWKANPQWQFSSICCLYLGLGPLFCCLLAALFIPRSSFGSAALRRLPLQQHQQSPLHSNRRDALLAAVESPATKHRWRPRVLDSKKYCCFRSSHKRHQEKEHIRDWSEHVDTSPSVGTSRWCFCPDVYQGRGTKKTTDSSKKQQAAHLRGIAGRGGRSLYPASRRLLQQISQLRLWSTGPGPDTKSQSDEFSATQQRQPPRLKWVTRQSQPSNNCLRPSDGMCHGMWRRSTEKIAARGGPLVTSSPVRAEASASREGPAAQTGPLATDTAGRTDVDANSGVFTLHKTANTEDISTGFSVRKETSRATTAVTTQTYLSKDVCLIGASRNSDLEVQEKACRCTSFHSVREHGSDRRPGFHGQQPCFSFSSLFMRLSSPEEKMESVSGSGHGKRYMLSRSTAQENNSKAQKQIYALGAAPPASAGGAATLRHPSAAAPEVGEDEEPSFCSQLLSSHFMCIVLYWSGMAVAISYFQSTASRLFSRKALDFMDVALSFSFVPCVLLGKMIDLFGPFPALFLVNTMGVLTYCCALAAGSQQSVLQYVSILAFCVYVSVDSEQVFCYVENTFNAKHFGKLSGLALTTGGVISLVSIPLYEDVTIRLLQKNPLPVCCGLMVVLVLLYFTLGSMWFVRLKHPPAFKAKGKQPESVDSATAYVREGGSAGAIEGVATDVEEFEEAYTAVDNDSISVAAEPPNCVPGKLYSLSCCYCGCCHGSSCRASTMSDNDDSVEMQRITVSAEWKHTCRPERHVPFCWLPDRITHLSPTPSGTKGAVEKVSQHKAEQQKRREGHISKGGRNNTHIETV